MAQVRCLGANPEAGRSDLAFCGRGQVASRLWRAADGPAECADLAARGVSFFAMELIPRITRAQSMDALSSMATIAGYQAVLLAADALPQMFPMLMTAAGTITPAQVFVLGAGVAGLQAIATARRLGAVVCAYDVRPAVKEQIESLGAKFVAAGRWMPRGRKTRAATPKRWTRPSIAGSANCSPTCSREQDVVITTAAVPGRKAPILITREMVARMAPGSVIVDLAAERGGNCELTRPGRNGRPRRSHDSGPVESAVDGAVHASQMFSSQHRGVS